MSAGGPKLCSVSLLRGPGPRLSSEDPPAEPGGPRREIKGAEFSRGRLPWARGSKRLRKQGPWHHQEGPEDPGGEEEESLMAQGSWAAPTCRCRAAGSWGSGVRRTGSRLGDTWGEKKGGVWGNGDQDQSPEAQGHEKGFNRRTRDRKSPPFLHSSMFFD